jgi:hypothetical protein
MRRIIEANILGKKVLILLILANIVYAFMLLVTIPKVMSFSNGMKLPDMLPTGYNPEYMNSLMNQLGKEGRDAYLFQQIPADMVYPLLFAISWCLVLAWFLNKLGKLNGSLFYLSLLPVFAGAFDYFENIGMIIILNSYPENGDTLTHITNVFSILKSTLTTVYFIALIIILLIFLIKKLKNKSVSQTY